MNQKPVPIFLIPVVFFGAQNAFAYTSPSLDYDLDLLDLDVIDVQVLFMDDETGYWLDNADLLKVTINVTNNGLEHFILLDKMFRIWVMEKGYVDDGTVMNDYKSIVDNYETVYDSHLEVTYDYPHSRELFEECDWVNKLLQVGDSKFFTICFDVLRIWNNEPMNIDGLKQYYLVMMNNQFSTSCPNCLKVHLSKYPIIGVDLPEWLQTVIGWYYDGLITLKDIENSFLFLNRTGIVSNFSVNNLEKEFSQITALEQKIRQLKQHQASLTLNQDNQLYVSSTNFYDSQYLGDFSGLNCKKQNNIVTLSGDYTNKEDISYDVMVFKLLILDDFGNVVATGLSKLVEVEPDDYRHFSVSAVYDQKINHCLVLVDSKFSRTDLK